MKTILNEASLYLRTTPYGCCFSNGKGNVSFSVIFDRSKVTHETANKPTTPIYFIKPKSAAHKQLLSSLYGRNGTQEERQAYAAMMVSLKIPRGPIDANHMNIFKDKTYFTLVSFKTFTEMGNYMLNRVGMGETTFTQAFGFLPNNIDKEADDSYVQIGDVDIWFTDTTKDSTKKRIAEYVNAAQKFLAKRYLGNLMKGTIRASAAKGKAMATYNQNDKNIRLNSAYMDSVGRAVFAIVHELGHRFHFDNDAPIDIDGEIREKYIELKKYSTEEQYRINTAPLKKVIDDIVENDVTIIYNGRSGKYFKRGDEVKVDMQSFANVKAMNLELAKVQIFTSVTNSKVSVNLAYLFTDNRFIFRMKGEHDRTFDAVEDLNQHHEEGFTTENWFVSNYARTNHQEFFAEMFAAYLLNKLNGDAAKWMEYIIEKYKGRFFG